MLNRLRRIWRNDRGVSAIEFALLAPILSTLFIGCIEITFKIWSTQKAEKLAVTMADVIAQSQNVSKADVDALTGSVDKIMDPFPFGTNGAVFISSVYRAQDETTAKVNWQCQDAGSLVVESKIGEKGDDATLPSGFTLAERDNVIIAEVFYKYEPIAPGVLFDEQVIYRRAIFKPRLGALTTPPTGC
ncbi:MAG TPA: TadE/TadG family type IV pilus assembly protein [Dongiaceae bacterium]